mmetsp:Transcript_89289/g.239228  ORF Transcript_89289/g.239228 Transcript_89289/m.239228 type:complete len:295 (+) Transcript_89289:116-1000(+)
MVTMSNLRTKSPKIEGKGTPCSFAAALTEAERDNTTAFTAAACSLVSARLFCRDFLHSSDLAPPWNASVSSSAFIFISSAAATCCCNSSLQATAPAAITTLLTFCNATLPAPVAAFTLVHWPSAGPVILPSGSSMRPNACCSFSCTSAPDSDVSSATSSQKSSVHALASPFNCFPCRWVTKTSDFDAKAFAALVASTIAARLFIASSDGGAVGGSAGFSGVGAAFGFGAALGSSALLSSGAAPRLRIISLSVDLSVDWLGSGFGFGAIPRRFTSIFAGDLATDNDFPSRFASAG